MTVAEVAAAPARGVDRVEPLNTPEGVGASYA
jgi:hypothetical protein